MLEVSFGCLNRMILETVRVFRVKVSHGVAREERKQRHHCHHRRLHYYHHHSMFVHVVAEFVDFRL